MGVFNKRICKSLLRCCSARKLKFLLFSFFSPVVHGFAARVDVNLIYNGQLAVLAVHLATPTSVHAAAWRKWLVKVAANLPDFHVQASVTAVSIHLCVIVQR